MGTARNSDEVILTHDLDYGQLVTLSGLQRPSVVIIRFEQIGAHQIADRLDAVWEQIDGALAEGAIVSLSDPSVRVRRLP